MIAIGDLSCVSSQVCNIDFAMERLRHRRIWHRLASTTETEYLDDGAGHSAVTSYTYVNTLSDIPTGNIVLSPKTKILVIDGDNARTYTWAYTYPYEMVTPGAWTTLQGNGYRRPVMVSVTAGTGSGSATTTRTEIWSSFGATFASGMSIVRPSMIAISRREPGAASASLVGPNITYSSYDKWGNPLQIAVDGQPTTTYIWGNDHARHLYERIGFTETDVVDEPDCHEVNMIYRIS